MLRIIIDWRETLLLFFFLVHLRMFPLSQWFPCLGISGKKMGGGEGKCDCEIILKKEIPLDLVGSLIFFTLMQTNELTCDTKTSVLSGARSGWPYGFPYLLYTKRAKLRVQRG